MDLANASAIVTGGAGGFGSATVRRLAQKGAKVVIADVSDERGEALAREVGSLYVSTDCMDEDAIAKAVKVATGLGPLRAAVITHIGPDRPGGRGPARMLDPDGV
jgi:NAD(P)-dependent dehydrogenase (short-subunit alcohol dehydrogenase family)